jgi:carbamoyltransferase
MKIAGLWNSHDCSFCVLEDGVPTIHAELERYTREKEPKGDSFKLFKQVRNEENDIDYWVTCSPAESFQEGSKRCVKVGDEFNHEIYSVGHHQAHAANAFYSSNFEESLIITIDGGGIELDGQKTCTTIWKGVGTKIEPLMIIPQDRLNIGNVWSRFTKDIFGLNVGYPYGHQAGSVMAMAAMGDRQRFRKWIDLIENSHGQTAPGYFFVDHFYKFLNETVLNGMDEKEVEQTKFDIAASLQQWTEDIIKILVKEGLSKHLSQNLCLSGGVSLNCVAITKIYDWFPEIKNIYTPPVPYDAGLPIGAAQYIYHHELGNPRVEWDNNSPTYLGEVYGTESVESAIENVKDKIIVEKCDDDKVVDLLDKQNIISVFGGGSESGRRALGNRSILADPRSPDMKDMINEKVKHRQWFRPFAPSVLREEVKNWFQKDIDSPYMSFCLKFKEDMKDKVPAVLHFDGTARLQTVSEKDNKWYHGFISKWFKKSGVPIVLNTSFNDREPIVETPEHAINCFMGTNIDYLYFFDEGILISKKG